MKQTSNVVKLAGLVLAGGRSSRMQQDKASLIFQKTTLIDRALHQLQQLPVAGLFVSGHYPNYPYILDLWPNSGPAAAILSAAGTLDAQLFTHVLVIPIDMPLLSSAILTYLLHSMQNDNLIEAVFIEAYPLPCCIKISALNKIFACYQDNPAIALKTLLTEHLNYQTLSAEAIDTKSLLNINTPQELKQLRDTYETQNSTYTHHL